MNILCIGDIVGKPGRHAIEGLLAGLKKEFKIDFVIVNAENSAGGAGITERIAEQLFNVGCDVLTLGDHVWDQKGIEEYLEEKDYILRPANFPEGVPGKGWCIKKTSSGHKVGVINLIGRVFMRYSVTCPFLALKSIVEQIQKETPIIIVDMHAEATSEKIALGWHLDGKVSAIFGTHTHIQTADEKILPKGTAYITDLGMTGSYDSVLGRDIQQVLGRFLTQMPRRFEVATDNVQLHGALFEIDEETGRALSVKRIQKKL